MPRTICICQLYVKLNSIPDVRLWDAKREAAASVILDGLKLSRLPLGQCSKRLIKCQQKCFCIYAQFPLQDILSLVTYGKKINLKNKVGFQNGFTLTVQACNKQSGLNDSHNDNPKCTYYLLFHCLRIHMIFLIKPVFYYLIYKVYFFSCEFYNAFEIYNMVVTILFSDTLSSSKFF